MSLSSISVSLSLKRIFLVDLWLLKTRKHAKRILLGILSCTLAISVIAKICISPPLLAAASAGAAESQRHLRIHGWYFCVSRWSGKKQSSYSFYQCAFWAVSRLWIFGRFVEAHGVPSVNECLTKRSSRHGQNKRRWEAAQIGGDSRDGKVECDGTTNTGCRDLDIGIRSTWKAEGHGTSIVQAGQVLVLLPAAKKPQMRWERSHALQREKKRSLQRWVRRIEWVFWNTWVSGKSLRQTKQRKTLLSGHWGRFLREQWLVWYHVE